MLNTTQSSLMSPQKQNSPSKPWEKNKGPTKKCVWTIIFPHAALYKYVPLSTLWCFYPYTGENPFSDTFTTQPLLFFSIKVTPRVSLFRPSHYLLTNSFSNSGPMYTNSTANISNTFLITYYFFLPCYSKWKSHNVVWLSEVGVWKWGRHCRIFFIHFFSRSTHFPQ